MAVTGEADGRFQVLAIDGGGLKGIFAAAALAGLESDYDSRLTDHFDLIVGTSTGGIVALGLAAGLSAQQIVDFYLQHQDEIFPRRLLPRLRRVWSTYDPAPLVECLAEAFGTMTLGESPIRLAIPSFDLTSNDVYLFRTPHFERLLRDKKERLVDVARATSAAPTFFPALDLRGVRLIDGGVWANNPSLVGVVEAAECCGGELGQIHLLNVGTTTELRLLPRKLDTGGLARWAPHATATVMRGQALAAFNHAKLLLGKERAHRVDVIVPSGLHRLDRVDARDLMGHASARSRHQSPPLRDFFRHQATSYVSGNAQG